MAVRYSTKLAELLAGGVSNDASLADIFELCVIDIYSGTQPTDADFIETGILLASMTVDGLPFVAGAGTNGLTFQAAGGGVLQKPTGVNWTIVPVVSGTPGWARCYSKDYVKGASTEAVRFDIACGIGYGEGRFAKSIVYGVDVSINSFIITFPRTA